jgi:heme O synthase-like polyprenyltransferase
MHLVTIQLERQYSSLEGENCLFSVASATIGFALFPDRLAKAVLLAAGVLLASGASVLNQYQESDLDAMMAQYGRRIPAGRISAGLPCILGRGEDLFWLESLQKER